METAFTVFGRPRQKGSKRAMIHKHTGKAMMMDMNKFARDWQAAVSAAAGAVHRGSLMRGPVEVHAVFTFARPKNQYRTGKRANELRDDAPHWHAKAPDVDKIVRTLLDGLSGVVFADDGQVQLGSCHKVWGDQDVTTVIVGELTP